MTERKRRGVHWGWPFVGGVGVGILVVIICLWCFPTLLVRVIGWRVPENRANAEDGCASRRVADAVIDDVLAGHHAQLYARMERRFREANPPDIFSSQFEKMFAFGGRPLKAEFKAQEDGVKIYLDGTRKSVRKFWYAAQTTRAEGGPYFLFVEVVHEEGGPTCTSVALVNFPVTGPPAHLR